MQSIQRFGRRIHPAFFFKISFLLPIFAEFGSFMLFIFIDRSQIYTEMDLCRRKNSRTIFDFICHYLSSYNNNVILACLGFEHFKRKRGGHCHGLGFHAGHAGLLYARQNL